MRFQTLQGWLDWIESCHPSDIELGLERVGQVALRLGLCFEDTKVITVAGTNGKGSCVAVLEHLLINSNLSVGSYTSPHFLRYNERIKVNAIEVDDKSLIRAFEKIVAVSNDIPLTYFEYGTLAALLVFASLPLDVIILEVGLGGRLDATNIVAADIAIVTSIAIDHEDWLGSDPAVIGREKAGIFRKDKIALCGDPNPPITIKETAEHLGAQFYQRGEHFDADISKGFFSWSGLSCGAELVQLDKLPLANLPLDSVVVAIQACQFLEFDIKAAVYQQLDQVALTGRFQKLQHQGRQLIFDVAHNPAAALLLANRLADEKIEGKTYALLAVMADKDVGAIVTALTDSFDAWLLTDLEALPRALKADALADCLKEHSISEFEVCRTMRQALPKALGMMTDKDRLVVFGSFFTVAAVLGVVQNLDQLEEAELKNSVEDSSLDKNNNKLLEN